jgi:hypothetical protein
MRFIFARIFEKAKTIRHTVHRPRLKRDRAD